MNCLLGLFAGNKHLNISHPQTNSSDDKLMPVFLFLSENRFLSELMPVFLFLSENRFWHVMQLESNQAVYSYSEFLQDAHIIRSIFLPANSADDKMMIFFLFFCYNIGSDILYTKCLLSCR